MSGFGNFLAGALGGGGSAVSSIASRYIDEEIQRNRAQAMADIQHANLVRGEEYLQSAPVQERRLGNERNLLQMRNQQQLASREAEASSPTLRQARIDDRVSFLEGTTPAEIASQNAITEGTAGTKLDAEVKRTKAMTPLEIARAGGIARVNADESIRVHAAYEADREKREKALKTTFDRLPEAKKLDFQNVSGELKDINKEIIRAQADGGWDPSKNQGHRQLELSKVALQQRLAGILTGQDGVDYLEIFGGKSSGEKPAPVEPKREQKGPSVIDRVSGWVASQMGAAQQQGLEYQHLQNRVREARAGGAPLSKQEREVARKYGIDAGGN